jgi:hypothetical protein
MIAEVKIVKPFADCPDSLAYDFCDIRSVIQSNTKDSNLRDTEGDFSTGHAGYTEKNTWISKGVF